MDIYITKDYGKHMFGYKNVKNMNYVHDTQMLMIELKENYEFSGNCEERDVCNVAHNGTRIIYYVNQFNLVN